MIKPSELPSAPDNSLEIQRVEMIWDAAISKSAKSGEWPAHPADAAATDDVMAEVASLYKACGWNVRRRKAPLTGWSINKPTPAPVAL